MRIGWIDYLNTMPFNFELTGVKPNIRYQLVKGVPSQINNLFFHKEVDIGFISSAHYIENSDRYLILPEISISSYNKVHSVIILSNIPMENITEVYMTKESKTSRYLLKVIFEKFINKKVRYLDLEGEIKGKDSVLLIGDNAIKYAHAKEYRYDLSQIWAEKTGLPFVFALWCVHKDYYEKYPSETKKLWKALKKSKEVFFENVSQFLINKEKIRYLENLDYCLTEEHLKSLKLFSKYLQQLNIIKHEPQLNLIDTKS